MKRTCHEITKNEHTITKLSMKKHQKTDAVNCFAWLPTEMVLKILEHVPQPLDKVTRLVSRNWRETIQTRWKHRIQKPTRACPMELVISDEERGGLWEEVGNIRVMPCVEWAIDNYAICLLKWLIGIIQDFIYNSANPQGWLTRACRAGNTQAIGWLTNAETPHHIRSNLTMYDVECAAKGGDLACYKFVFFQSSIRGNPRIEDIYAACRGGHLDTVQWAMSNCGIGKKYELRRQPKFQECLLAACRGGHKHVVDWLIAHITDSAMFRGNRDLTVEYTATAIRHGHLNLAKHLFNHWKCPVGPNVLDVAVRKGNVKGFRFVWDALIGEDQEEFYVRPWVCVERRYFDMLNLLAEKDCLKQPDFGLFKMAVRDDQHDLAMLRWLWKHCNQDAIAVDLRADAISCNVVFMKALYSGHLDILDWLQGLGFGWGLTGYGLGSASRLPMAGSISVLETLAIRSQSKEKATLWNTTGRHGRGPKASLIWLHQQVLVDLSEARVLSNGKIWFHFDCDHQEKKNPAGEICDEVIGFEDTNIPEEEVPWSYSTQTATGEYLIARKSK